MRPARALVAPLLAALLLSLPLAPAGASGEEETSESRVGAALAVLCGFAARVTPIAPVPWGGIAVVTCLMALVDAANSP